MISITKIANGIVPEVFTASMERKLIRRNALIQSGVIVRNSTLDSLITGAGVSITIPRFEVGEHGEDEPLTETEAIKTEGLSQTSDIAHVLIRGRGFANHDLVSAFTGDDFVAESERRITEYWLTRSQKLFLATLNGVFASEDMSPLVANAKGINVSASLILDAESLLDEASDKLNTIFVHPQTLTEMKKQDLIEYIKPSNGGLPIPTYLNKYTVVVDSDIKLNRATGETESYLLARGAFGGGSGMPTGLVPLGVKRDEEYGTTKLFSRRASILHPYGFQCKNIIAKPEHKTMANADLENGLNWKRTAEIKSIGMIKINHKVEIEQWLKDKAAEEKRKRRIS